MKLRVFFVLTACTFEPILPVMTEDEIRSRFAF